MLRVAQSHSRSAPASASAAAEQSLPGGDTRFDDNHVRLGNVTRSLMAQHLMPFDDVCCSANQPSCYAARPVGPPPGFGL